jgi:SAM-dependent methyltransferase
VTERRCAACGHGELLSHLHVAGSAGDEGLIPSTDRFGVALGDFVRCPTCGHLQLEPMPSEEELAAAYRDAASEDYEEEEVGQRATAAAELERIERHARPGRLADLGCWTGFLMDEARRRGWQPVGVEPSEWAAERARERGFEVEVAPLLEAGLPAGRFAAVTMGDVIEHLPDLDAPLEEVRRLLAPGGVVWLVTPDASSRVARLMGRRWWSVIPTHVHLFTRQSIVRVLERNGFDVLEIGTSPKTFSVRYYLERLAGYSPPLARAVVAAGHRVGVADHLWTPDFRDRMAVVARVRAGD